MTTLLRKNDAWGGLFSPSFIDNMFNETYGKHCEISSDYPYDIFIERGEENQPICYKLRMALSGFSKKDISVKVIDDNLIIEINVAEKEEREYIHHGIAHRNSKVVFKLGSKVDIDKITSKYEDGLLKIDVPIIEKAIRDIKFID